MRIGFDRPVENLKESGGLGRQLPWQIADAGGWVAALTLISPGAVGMRLGIQVKDLPDRAELRFFAPGNSASSGVILVRGELVNHLMALNLNDSASDPRQARTYWSPVIEGEAIALEIYLPADLAPKDLSLTIPHISHLYRTPIPTAAQSRDVGDSDACELDVMCADTAWQEQGKAVAKMILSDFGGSYLCTGTLLSDKDTSSFIPYFLSANHCISSQSVASTLDTYWFYRASSCDSGHLSSSSRHITGGATLLYATEDTDTSFMRLNTDPPSGVRFSGWDSVTPAIGTNLQGLHQPSGDLQKISAGVVTGYVDCSDAGGDSFFCTPANQTGNHLEIVWNSGLTEAGSSGSGLFSPTTFKLIGGQLHGGSSYCQTPTEPDYYGRFDLAYQHALSQWLNASSSPPHVLANTRDFVMQQYRDFLNREGEIAGIDYWISQIDSGDLTRAQVVEQFFNSPEFQTAPAAIARLYFAYFGRIPDYGGLQYWIGQYQTGVNLTNISQSFAASNEFQSIYGSLSNEAYVELVYQNVLGRAPDATGRAYWLGRLSSGLSRSGLMIGFSESEEYQIRSQAWVQVTMLYVGLLRRAPEQAGFDYWTTEIGKGHSVLDLINEFLASPEYIGRFP